MNPIPPEDAPSDPVTRAVLAAQRDGRAKLEEMAYVLDQLIGERCVSMGVWARSYDADTDWRSWGRRTYVLEETLAFLNRLLADGELREVIHRKLRDPRQDPRIG